MYHEIEAVLSGEGILIIDNNGQDTYGTAVTLMSPNIDLDDFADIIIRNKGNFAKGTHLLGGVTRQVGSS